MLPKDDAGTAGEAPNAGADAADPKAGVALEPNAGAAGTLFGGDSPLL